MNLLSDYKKRHGKCEYCEYRNGHDCYECYGGHFKDVISFYESCRLSIKENAINDFNLTQEGKNLRQELDDIQDKLKNVSENYMSKLADFTKKKAQRAL